MKHLIILTGILLQILFLTNCNDSLGITETVIKKDKLNTDSNMLKSVYMMILYYDSTAQSWLPVTGNSITIPYGSSIRCIGFYQNVSDTTLTFRTKNLIKNIATGKTVYSNVVNISDNNLMKQPDDPVKPYTTTDGYVRLVSYDDNNGNITFEELPYPDPQNPNGIPSGAYVKVEYMPFEPNEFIESHYGEMEIYSMIIPINPVSGEEFIDPYPVDDSLKINLQILRP